jgi:catechol 2,3-dioxygenase-like lactoylglutathione lyase family enzyme
MSDIRTRCRLLWRAAGLLTVLPLAAGSCRGEPESRPLVEAIGPIGLTVRDMDASVAFYTEVLAFEKVADEEAAGDARRPGEDRQRRGPRRPGRGRGLRRLQRTIDTPQKRRERPTADHTKWVEPAGIADVILFLASDAARAVNGAAVPVYGRG